METVLRMRFVGLVGASLYCGVHWTW